MIAFLVIFLKVIMGGFPTFYLSVRILQFKSQHKILGDRIRSEERVGMLQTQKIHQLFKRFQRLPQEGFFRQVPGKHKPDKCQYEHTDTDLQV